MNRDLKEKGLRPGTDIVVRSIDPMNRDLKEKGLRRGVTASVRPRRL